MIETGHETELATRFASTHDPQAREALILRYVPLVHYVLGRLGIFRSIGSDYDDLAGQGLLGLIDAVDRYDPAHGTQFSTYATLRIRGQILDHLRSIDWLPRTARQRARQVEEAITSLWGSLDRAPGDEELAAHLHMDIAQLRQALVDSSRVVLSLDSEVDGDGEDGSLHEYLADEGQADPAETIQEMELRSTLLDLVQDLSEREQLVLSLYYHEGLTLKEIGQVLGVSESRICQLHGRAVLALRGRLLGREQSAAGAGMAFPGREN